MLYKKNSYELISEHHRDKEEKCCSNEESALYAIHLIWFSFQIIRIKEEFHSFRMSR